MLLDETDLRHWGVPSSASAYVAWDYQTSPAREPVPILFLHEDWPNVGPRLPDIVQTIRGGVGLSLSCPFDLNWIAEVFDKITVLHCPHDGRDLSGASRIQEMSSLEEIWSPYTHVPSVDLGNMQTLAVALIRGPGMVSALNAPAVRDAGVDVSSLNANIGITSSMKRLAVSAREIDMDHLTRSAPNLVDLTIMDCDTVDLAFIGGLSQLFRLRLAGCRTVLGVQALTNVAALKELDMEGIRHVDAPWSIFDLDLTRFYAGSSRDFDKRFAKLAKSRGWGFAPSRAASSSKFEVSVVEGGVVISFTEWDWLAEVFDVSVADVPTSYELELAVSRVIEEHAGSARIPLTFDSEGDQVVLQVRDLSDASQLVQILDTFLADSEKIREYLATTRA